jgi:flagellar hook-associated protein 2
MSTSATPIFNGTSTFSTALQQVITNAVSLASLPMNQLQGEVTTLTSEQTALSSLSTSFSSLQSDVAAIDSAVSSGSYSATSSDTSVATATGSAGALPGTYSLDVISTGSQSNAQSTATVTDPTTQNISSATTFTLVANGQQYTIVPPPSSNSLDSLVTAINTTTEGAVQATVINVGTISQPSYQLSLQNTEYSPDPITLDDGTGNILNSGTTGSPVTYTINGDLPDGEDPSTSNSLTLAISPGVSATVTGTGTTNITVGQSVSSISNAISTFVKDYNSAVTAVAGQRGSSGGALAGQGVVSMLSEALQNLTYYTATGSIQSIADLGLTFSQTGVLSFNPTVLSAAASSDFQGVTSFLGSAAGGGFLQAATNVLSSVMEPRTGEIPTETSAVAGEIASINSEISADQSNLNTLQTSLTNQMDSADALIATMQQQYSYVTSLFSAMTANETANP